MTRSKDNAAAWAAIEAEHAEAMTQDKTLGPLDASVLLHGLLAALDQAAADGHALPVGLERAYLRASAYLDLTPRSDIISPRTGLQVATPRDGDDLHMVSVVGSKGKITDTLAFRGGAEFLLLKDCGEVGWLATRPGMLEFYVIGHNTLASWLRGKR